MKTSVPRCCNGLRLARTAIMLIACFWPVLILQAASLGRLADGREYIFNEVHFALRAENAAELSNADSSRRSVNKGRIQGLNGNILEIKAGQSCARNWLDGKPLPQHVRHKPNEVPVMARSLTAVLKPNIDAALFLDEFRRLPEIEWASLSFLYRPAEIPNDPDYPRQWGPQLIGAEEAWDVSQASASLDVAIVDTGVDLDHPEFSGIISYQEGFGAFSTGDAPHNGLNGADHGTLVAGVVAARRNNAVGIAGIARVQIMAMNCASWSSTKQMYMIVNADDAINEAVAQGAEVINCSFGDLEDLTSSYASALDNAESHGVLVVAAAGNDGTNMTGLSWDQHDWPLIISATDPSDTIAGFSNFGSAIDMAAPGVAIWSTSVGGYGSASGTSFAAPHVAGAAVLTKSMNPALIGGAALKGILNRTALDLGIAGGDPLFGHGRLRLQKDFLQVLRNAGAFVGNVNLFIELGTYELPFNSIPSALQHVPAGSTLVLNGGLWVPGIHYPPITINARVTLTALPDQPVTIGP